MGKRILIAAPVYQKEEIFKEYLNSLDHLIIPEGYEVKRFFYLHNSPQLKKFLKEDEYIELINNINLTQNQNDRKNWTLDNYKIVSQMRNYILKYAKDNNFDYIFSVDSDVLLHPNTLLILIKDNQDIVGHLSWTKFNNNSTVSSNCAQFENWKQIEEIQKNFLIPNFYEGGWTGRTTLISSRIINNEKINYDIIPGVDNTGSEDYAFCLKAYCNIPNLKIGFETRIPSRHLYNQKDYERWMKEKAQYE